MNNFPAPTLKKEIRDKGSTTLRVMDVGLIKKQRRRKRQGCRKEIDDPASLTKIASWAYEGSILATPLSNRVHIIRLRRFYSAWEHHNQQQTNKRTEIVWIFSSLWRPSYSFLYRHHHCAVPSLFCKSSAHCRSRCYGHQSLSGIYRAILSSWNSEWINSNRVCVTLRKMRFFYDDPPWSQSSF